MKRIQYLTTSLIFSLFITFCCVTQVKGQQAQGAVKINTMLVSYPYPIFLSDFISPTGNKLMLQLLFTDSYESSRDVFFRIRIESNSIRVSSKQNFRPQHAISLIPYTPYNVTSVDLTEYLDYINLDINGVNLSKFEQSGGLLPEGTYYLNVQVYDYLSGAPLSDERTTIFNVQLFEPPLVISPVNKSIIKNTNSQSIPFQWQMSFANNMMYSVNNTIHYDFFLYRNIDPTIDPQTAIDNGAIADAYEVLGVNNSNSNNTTFIYDNNKPLLQKGEKYVFRIRARDEYNHAVFKNDGYSKAGWFYYGYPQGGKVPVEFPENNHGFSLRETKVFQWQPPDNLIEGEQYYSKLTIVELQDGQMPQDALDFNLPYYSYQSSPTNALFRQDHFVQKNFESLKTYAWQVKSYCDDTEIASSEPRVFFGPPVMEMFKAGNHVIDVITTTTTTLDNLTGTGKTKISANEKVDVEFKNIKLQKIGNQWFLEEGVVEADLIEPIKYKLSPEVVENQEAWFYASKIRVTPNAKELFGHIEWNIPMLIKSENENTPPVVKTVPGWVNFDNYYLLGSQVLDDKSRHLEMLDPVNFSIDLSEGSNILMRNDFHYILRFVGLVNIPEKVRDADGNKIALQFKNDQLFYFDGKCPGLNIRLIDKSEVVLSPETFIVDFSDEKSPEKYKDEPEWKGVLFDSYGISWHQSIDKKGQLELYDDIARSITYTPEDSAYCHVTSTGLNLLSYQYFSGNSENLFFKTFPSIFRDFYLKIADNKVAHGYVKGNMLLPIYSDTARLNFTIPIFNNGFGNGDLDKSLNGSSFVFNPGDEEKKLLITIDRAVFADDERLDMTLDIEWPGAQAKIGKVSGFKAWGDYSIGFGSKGGVKALSQQVTGELKTREILIEYIGAGKNPGLYAIGFGTQINMGEGITGPDGPPRSNIYSICEKNILGQTQRVPRSLNLNSRNLDFSDGSDIVPPGAITPADISQTTDKNVEDPIAARLKLEEEKTKATNNVLARIDQGFSNIDTIALSKFKYQPSSINPISKEQSADNKPDKIVDKDSLYAELFGESLDKYRNEEENADSDNNQNRLEPINQDEEFSREKLIELIDKIGEIAPEEISVKIADAKQFVLELEDEYQLNLFEDLKNLDSLISKILKQEYEKLVDKAIQPIQAFSDSANKYIENSVGSITRQINIGISYAVDTAINSIKKGLYDLSDDEAAHSLINNVSKSVRDVIVNDITGRVNEFTEEYIISPITDDIIAKISSIIYDSLQTQLLSFGNTIIDDRFEADITGLIDINRIIKSISDEVLADLFNVDTITARMVAMKDAFFKEYFDPADIIDDILTQLAVEGMSFLADELKRQTNDLDTLITRQINGIRDEITNGVSGVVDNFIDGVADAVKDVTDPDAVDFYVDDVAGIVSASITNTVNGRINDFTYSYFTKPITVDIIGKVSGIVQDSIRAQIKALVKAMDVDAGNTNFIDEIDLPAIFISVKNAIIDDILNPDSILNDMIAMRDGFINSFLDFDKLTEDILSEALALAPDVLADIIGEEITNAVVDGALDDYGAMPGVSDELADIAINSIPLDFTNFSDKLASEGDTLVGGFDPISLDYTSKIVDVVGKIYLINHETYGEVYTGNVDVLMKAPKRFKASAMYLNGTTTNKLNYWFVGFNGVTQKSSDGISGGYIPLGLVNILRINGYVYHNMTFSDDFPVPDAAVDFGGDLGLTLIDAATMGSGLFLNLDARLIVKDEGYIDLEMDGSMTLGNNGGSPLAEGTLELDFNSEEEHYYGKGWVGIENEGLCAEGTVIVDLEKDAWRVAIGTQEERISVVPACFGWGAQGWLDVNQNIVELGLGVSVSASAKSPSFKFLADTYWGYCDFGFAAGVKAVVQYKPKVLLNEAGLWAEAWAEVGVGKKSGITGNTKHYEIASAFLYGEANMRFNPPPTKAYGYLEGRFSVLGLFTKTFTYSFDTVL